MKLGYKKKQMGIVFLAERGRREIIGHERKKEIKKQRKNVEKCTQVYVNFCGAQKMAINTDRPRKS